MATLLGFNVRRLGAAEDLHHLEEAQATRQLKTIAKLPCSHTCYCRLLPKQNELPVTFAKPGRLPESQPSEKKFRDSSFEMMFTIISSSSSSSFGSGNSESLDHSTTVNGSPTSIRSKVLSPPGLSPTWKLLDPSNITMSPTATSSPIRSSLNRRQVVNTPPAAHLRRDTRREVQDGLRLVSPLVPSITGPRPRSPSFA